MPIYECLKQKTNKNRNNIIDLIVNAARGCLHYPYYKHLHLSIIECAQN